MMANSNDITLEGFIGRKIREWFLEYRYEPDRTPLKQRTHRFLQANAPQVVPFSTIGNALETVVEAYDQFRNPLHHLKLSPTEAEALNSLLQHCHLQRPLPFWYAFPFWKQETAVKIAEGSYGEVYTVELLTREKRILKIVAVHGSHPISSFNNMTFNEILPDVISSLYLKDLLDGVAGHSAPNFPRLHHVCLVTGSFPQSVMRAWWDFAEKSKKEDQSSKNEDPDELPQPDLFDHDQLFVALEMEPSGTDLSKWTFKLPSECVVFIGQIAAALAVAESVYKFEHRDLHWNNILIRNTEEKRLEYKMGNLNFWVQTLGLQICIIDFTMSRITIENQKTYSYPISWEMVIHERGNSEQGFDWCDYMHVFSKMAYALNGQWEAYRPVTNIFWIRHLIEMMLKELKKEEVNLNSLSGNERKLFVLLEEWRFLVQQYDSAFDLVTKLLINYWPFEKN